MILVYVIILFAAAVTIRQSVFLSPATLINLARADIFTLCFAISEMVVMISGGIDVSFPAIGCAAMYVPMYLFDRGMIPDNGLIFFLIALVCALILGIINGVLVSYLNIPSLIATLATSSIAAGGLAFVFGVKAYSAIPASLDVIYRMNICTYIDKNTGIFYPLTILIVFPVILCVFMGWFLKYTSMGMGLYAVGGSASTAGTVGFNVHRIQMFAYVFSAGITGITAVLYVILMHTVTTTSIMNSEMLVIAACVIGGCKLTGGHGNVMGVVLGTLLITLIQNYLNMLGIETVWQTFAVGIVLFLGITATSLRDKISLKQKGGAF